MYRLLIVDDEPSIVDGLTQHFQEMKELELDICKAYSAEEALDIVKRTKIDITISDIQMPGRNGLDLAEDIQSYWPACRMIILTGYSEFDYAYSAIQRNVSSYILKTEGIEPIVEAVKASITRIDEENRNRDILENARQQATVAKPLLTKEFFEALLLGESASSILRGDHFARLELHLDRELPILMIVGKVDEWEEGVSYSNKHDIFDDIQQIFARHLLAAFQVESTVSDHSVLVWFIQPATDANYLKAMLEPVQNDCKDLLGITISFVVSGDRLNWNEVGQQFGLLKSALQKSMEFGQKMAVIDLGMHEGFSMWESGKSADREHILIERIHKFIGENLGGDLSLARIAESVYFNPSYLSRFYKQNTGRNISEYMNATKAQAAITMLGNMQLKVNEIALKLGFESPSYFTAFFRKMTGRTPLEYRETLQNKW
ncbi:response regulator transcription factor [Cohnella soli]|uniref:Response regulator n=1 Tax=Cohnella soli TaxID=425005 RepID=A0ABW0HW16_9BACL